MSTDLIQEDEATTMQQQAVMGTKVVVTDSSVNEVEEKEKNAPEFFSVKPELIVTLNFTDRRMFNNKAQLGNFPTKSGHFNLYAPFRRAKKDSGKPNGVVREVLPGLVKAITAIGNSNILLLGKPSDLFNYTKQALNTVKNRLSSLSPIDRDVTIIQLVDDSDPQNQKVVDTIRFSDIMDLTTWVCTREPSVTTVERIAFNLKVNVGQLYDTTDRHTVIQQIESVLLNYATESLNIHLLLNIDPAFLTDFAVRELLDYLLDEGGFTLFSRDELVSNLKNIEWLPPTKTQLDRDLLVDRGDIVLCKLVGAVMEEEVKA